MATPETPWTGENLATEYAKRVARLSRTGRAHVVRGVAHRTRPVMMEPPEGKPSIRTVRPLGAARCHPRSGGRRRNAGTRSSAPLGVSAGFSFQLVAAPAGVAADPAVRVVGGCAGQGSPCIRLRMFGAAWPPTQKGAGPLGPAPGSVLTVGTLGILVSVRGA
ncbi:hypothetical protein ACFPRL_01220 [Pseudoclavibacter helvolus]